VRASLSAASGFVSTAFRSAICSAAATVFASPPDPPLDAGDLAKVLVFAGYSLRL